MYLAEIHGKLSRENENKEDILTSNVFSFFKYTDRSVFLYRFLSSIGLDITVVDAINAEFNFWPSFDDYTEPDLVIIVGDYYLLIEAKYTSGFGKETEFKEHQLIREINGGQLEANNLEKSLKIIAVTEDYYKPDELARVVPKKFLPNLIWLNWQSIAFFINHTLESDHKKISLETYLLANDLYRLLLKKNLRNFEGIKALEIGKSLLAPPEQVFFSASTASYRGDFIGFLATLISKQLLKNAPRRIFFAAGTATFRGDFIGFLDMFQQDQNLKRVPGIIFFTVPNLKRFSSIASGSVLKSSGGIIFFHGGSHEQKRNHRPDKDSL